MAKTKQPAFRIKKGRLKGELFIPEGTLEEVFGEGADLPTLASRGNPTAINALEIDGYRLEQEPFYYGKVNGLGYFMPQDYFGGRQISPYDMIASRLTSNRPLETPERSRILQIVMGLQDRIKDTNRAFSEIEYNGQALGCGLEDRGITDRYEAMAYGWEQAIEYLAERINLEDL